jgi:hypothetical protein
VTDDTPRNLFDSGVAQDGGSIASDGGTTDGGDVREDAGVDAGPRDAGTAATRDESTPPGADLSAKPGETCQSAQPLTPGEYRGLSLAGYANDYRFAQPGVNRCTSSDNGPDRVFVVTVPAGQRLIASVSPESAGFDPSIYLVSSEVSCDEQPRRCLSSDDSGAAQDPNRAYFTNTNASDARVLVIVDSRHPTVQGGAFTLTVALDTPPPFMTCGTYKEVGPGILGEQTTLGYSNSHFAGLAPSCRRATPGLDRGYAISIPPQTRLSATVRPEASYDLSLILIEGDVAACEASPLRCLEASDSGGAGVAEVVRAVNATDQMRRVFLIVDSATQGAAGQFELDVAFEGVPAGDTCTNAEVVAAGTYTGQHTSTYGNDYGGASNGVNNCTSSDRGLDRAYRVELPPGMRLTASVVPEGATDFDPSITLVEGPAERCAAVPRVCLASDDFGASTERNFVQRINNTSQSETLFIIIDTYLPGGEGAFALTVDIDSAPAGDRCIDAIAIGAGRTEGHTTLGFTNDYVTATSNGCTRAALGLDRVYRVDVPSGKRLVATATPAASYDLALTLIEAPASNCDAAPRVCLASSNVAGAGAAETARVVNGSDAAKTVYVIVDSAAYGGGTFDLDVAFDDPPSGDSCANAEPAPVAPAVQTTSSYTDDVRGGEGCLASPGPDRVYAVNIPDATELVVTVTPSPLFDVLVHIVDGPTASRCEGAQRACLASVDVQGAGTAEIARHRNWSGATRPVFVVVDSAAPMAGELTIQVDLLPLPARPEGDLCRNATTLVPDTLVAGTTDGWTDDYHAPLSCTGFSTLGPDRAYAISVGAGQELTVVVTPAAFFDASLLFVKGPASRCESAGIECIGGADRVGRGQPEVVHYRNESSQAETVFVVVDGYAVGESGAFGIQATLDGP